MASQGAPPPVGGAIKRILYRRLPDRLAATLPPLAVEIGVGLLAALLMVGIRYQLFEFAGDRAPFAFTFVAIVLAAVLAGWRAGLVALGAGQLLTWYLLIEPRFSFALADAFRWNALLIATFSEALILIVIALYQREVDKGVSAREERMDLLTRALEEIDHRTRNNYQTVLALVQLQSQRSEQAEVREALNQVADRIQALTLATERLGHRSEDLGVVRLRDHLCGLCDQVERGLSRDGVKVQCDIDDLVASTEKAAYLSIIVNELLTNALKHAFRDTNEGVIRVHSQHIDQGVAIIVEDNGSGMTGTHAKGHNGLGTRLVERFARELASKHEVRSSAQGTVHRLLIPSLT